MSDKVLSAESAKKAVNGVSSTIKDADLSASTASKISTNLDTPITYSGDDVIVGWSDTTPNSASASATSGGGYIKLDDSFLTGETIVTLPVSKKLYTVDDNGNLKKDDNGNAIEASWNEQSLHKLRKGFITSVSSSPLSLVYKVGSQGVGFLARTTTINLAVAAATRFSNSRQRANYITCDATFINPNDPASMTSADGDSGRFTIKNAKLNVLSFEPEYDEKAYADFNKTTSTDIAVDDSVIYQINEDNYRDGKKPDRVIGHLNIGFDFESISRTEAWDTFLNEVAGTRKSTNRTALGLKNIKKSQNKAIMRLELSIHKNNPKSSKQAIGSPTFSFLVAMLPRDDLKVEYDVSSPYVSRNYSFQIIEPSTGYIKFSFITDGHKNGKNIPWNFTLIGRMPKDGLEVEEILENNNPFDNGRVFNDVFELSNNLLAINVVHRKFARKIAKKQGIKYGKKYGDDPKKKVETEVMRPNYIQEAATNIQKLDFASCSDVRVVFTLDNVKLLSRGENGTEFDETTADNVRPSVAPGIDLCGSFLCKKIQNIVSRINNGLARGRSEKGRKTSHNTIFDSETLPILSFMRYYGNNAVESENFFDFVSNGNSPQFMGIQLIQNYSDYKHKMYHPLLEFRNKKGKVVRSQDQKMNFVKMAVYFSFKKEEPCECNKRSASAVNWRTLEGNVGRTTG